jgi:hypothetical protein
VFRNEKAFQQNINTGYPLTPNINMTMTNTKYLMNKGLISPGYHYNGNTSTTTSDNTPLMNHFPRNFDGNTNCDIDEYEK